MKKILILIAAIMLMASNLYAAGSCTETVYDEKPSGVVVVKLDCTGDSGNGSIPTISLSSNAMALIKYSYYFLGVIVDPGATQPDAADVTVNMLGMDLLGGKGVNLIHATSTQDVLPYSTFLSAYRYLPIIDSVTFAVANQSTVSATYTAYLMFVK